MNSIIIQFDGETGKEVGRFNNMCEAARKTGSTQSCISRVIDGKRRSHRGSIWRREEVAGFGEFLKEQQLTSEEIEKSKRWQTYDGEVRYSVTVKEDSEKLEQFSKNLTESIKKYAKAELKLKYKKQSKCCGIINIFDCHIDKLTLLSETGTPSSSIKKNVETFEKAFDELLATCISFHPELIIFPVANDFFNTNGPGNTTLKGTPMEVLIKSEDSFIEGIRIYRRCIDKAYKYCAKVYCPLVPGNHSSQKDFYLGECLKIVYEKNKNVEIGNGRIRRDYIQYGNNMFGFAHGDIEAKKINYLPLLMAEEKKEMWANTSYREWFLGDKHHKMEYKFLKMKDFIGCTVHFLRGLSTLDKWHADQGYIGIPRTAELFIYDKVRGLKANFLCNL